MSSESRAVPEGSCTEVASNDILEGRLPPADALLPLPRTIPTGMSPALLSPPTMLPPAGGKDSMAKAPMPPAPGAIIIVVMLGNRLLLNEFLDRRITCAAADSTAGSGPDPAPPRAGSS